MPYRVGTELRTFWALWILSAFVADGFGQIVEGKTEIKVNQGLQFGGTAFGLPSSEGRPSFDIRNDFKTADLILATTICPLCVGCCCLWELGSSRPFYISKIKFDSTDFSQALDLKNSSKYEIIDSIKENSRAHLPHSSQIPIDGKYFVLVNSTGKFVLLTVSEIIRYIPDYSNPTRQCSNGVKTNWWIQNSGYPHFPKPSSVINTPNVSETKNSFFDFQINGRKIPDNAKKSF